MGKKVCAISALGRGRREDGKCAASLGYLRRPCRESQGRRGVGGRWKGGGGEMKFFRSLDHSIHTIGFSLQITGSERDFFAYCYFGCLRHSIRGATPHQHTPHLYNIPFQKCFLKATASVYEVVLDLTGYCHVFNASRPPLRALLQ